MSLFPGKFVYIDHLTLSAKRLFIRLGVALLGVAIAGAGIGLLNKSNWDDVVAGALFAWSTSFIAWAVISYRARTEETSRELRHMAELDLLHSRMNHFAHKNGLPLLDLQGEIEAVISSREERLAHFAGLDEYRPMGPPPETDWWDEVALGCPPDFLMNETSPEEPKD